MRRISATANEVHLYQTAFKIGSSRTAVESKSLSAPALDVSDRLYPGVRSPTGKEIVGAFKNAAFIDTERICAFSRVNVAGSLVTS